MSVFKRIGQGALLMALLVMTGCRHTPASSSLLLGGDVMLYRGGIALFPDEYSAFSPWGDLLAAMRMETVDLFAVNLESPFGLGEVTDTPVLTDMNLCAADPAVGLLQQAGVGLVTNANNHVMDCGLAGPEHTAIVLAEAGIQNSGNQSPVQFIPLDGQVMAVLSLDDHDGHDAVEKIQDEIEVARDESDLVLVSIHWGQEYQAGPTAHQQELAQTLIDAGADVIWGHHPHVLQRMEWMRSTLDGHAGLVMYSLGNILSDQWMLPDALRTAVVRIEFTDHQIKDILVIPMEMDASLKRLMLMKEPQQREWSDQRLGLAGLEKRGVTIRIFEFADDE